MADASFVLRALKAAALNPDLLFLVIAAITVAMILVATAVTLRKGAVADDSWSARYARRLKGTVPAMFLMGGITFVVGLQGNFERAVQAWHGWDFTWIVYAVEGRLPEWVQDTFRRPWLDGPVVIVYSLGAFLVYQLPFLALVALGRGRSAMRVAATLGVVWAVGIVCYFFVPVYEVWVTAGPPYNWTHVENVYFQYVPGSSTSYSYETAINNNFPSLHVGATSAIAFALLFARERWVGVPAAIVAAGVAFATVYLGIHWVSDAVAGLLLAGGAAWLIHRKLPQEPEPARIPFTRGRGQGAASPAEEGR